MNTEEKRNQENQGVENVSVENGSDDNDTTAGKETDKDLGTQEQIDADASGNELDNNLTGDELDDDLTGNELDDDLTGNELDDDLTGNELDDDLTGDELDEADNTGNGASVDTVVSNQAEDRVEAKLHNEKPDTGARTSGEGSSRYKIPRKIALAVAAAVLLCVVGGFAFVHWSTPPEIKREAAEVEAPDTDEIIPVSMDAFLIPFSLGKFSYISLNVSIEVPTRRIRNEIIAKKDLIRGQIYELLSVYVQGLANAPVPNDIKTIISKGINESLSNGSVRELYLTQFIVI